MQEEWSNLLTGLFDPKLKLLQKWVRHLIRERLVIKGKIGSMIVLKEEVARIQVQQIPIKQKPRHFFVGSSNARIVMNWGIEKTV
jgi:hypothetical protein